MNYYPTTFIPIGHSDLPRRNVTILIDNYQNNYICLLYRKFCGKQPISGTFLEIHFHFFPALKFDLIESLMNKYKNNKLQHSNFTFKISTFNGRRHLWFYSMFLFLEAFV